MGAGKTTLIKALVKAIGITNCEVSSPTYSLVNHYTQDAHSVFHFDFYRIEDEEEAYNIGFEEYFIGDSWQFIEWPDKIYNLLPEQPLQIKVETINNNTRQITIKNI